jgi:hypothetical protein
MGAPVETKYSNIRIDIKSLTVKYRIVAYFFYTTVMTI